MHDFLEDNNVCGQNLLRIVSQGNAIIAEIHHLSDMVPNVFRMETISSNNRQNMNNNNFSDLIMDFNYFKSSDSIERRIENDEKLLIKDEELRETYIELLVKFYLLFESIHRYAIDLERYLTELDDGIYIQQTIETVLMDHDGKQLLCEALYLMGVILLTMDHEINGIVRERMLVSYYRYSASRSCDSRIDDVCNLIRSTGYAPSTKRPINYPEDFFKRTKIRTSFARLIIGRLRTDDVYNLSSVYPKPEHRSVGLSTQASMLFVCLYFVPEILSTEFAIMREIVDKFFADNFVISIYMGTIVNLIEHWDPYKAAKAALNNTVDGKNIRTCAKRFRNEMEDLNGKIPQFLKEGIITEETILNKINEYMNTSRNANVTLRWIMLHTVPMQGDFIDTHQSMKRCRQIREQIITELKFNSIDLFHLLLNTSEFELRIRDIYKQILQNRHDKVIKYREESYSRIKELAEVFSGQKPLSRIEPNANLQNWFENFAKKIDDICLETDSDRNQANQMSRKLIQLIKALEEIQELGQLESNLQIKQCLCETHNYLCLMIKTIGIRDEILVTQQIIADLSYAWRIIDDCFTQFMQKGIKKDPSLVAKLRAAFLKLASALDLPLLRINQASSPDLIMVSQFYSSELVSYVRKVLHIIPETMFTLMANIINIQTNTLRELPTRLMKDQLKNYAQLDERYEIARLTHSISVFTEGVLAMKTTLVGVIQIDPKKLLEEGIRRELVRQVAAAFHHTIVFNSKSKNIEILSKLEELKKIMDGFRRTFEYIQDYVCINGLKMWQEELSRIINYNVEQECNAFMRQKVLDYQSLYQSKSVPIPKYPPLDQQSSNFIGRIVRELTRITDYRTTIYVYGISAWHDQRTRSEIIDSKLFSLILKNFGVAGTNGLDRLLSFQIVAELNTIFTMIDTNFTRSKSTIECFAIINNYLNNETPNGIITSKSFIGHYLPMMNRLSKILSKLAESIGHLGQLQIIRQNLVYELRMASKFHARQLSSALEVLNNALMTDFQKQSTNIINDESLEATEKLSSIFKDESPLLFELSNYLEYNGQSEPLLKIYTKNRLPPNFETILLLLLISQMPKFIYVKDINALTSSVSSQKNNESIDGTPFIFGILTILRQFHNDLSIRFFRFSSQFVNACIQAAHSPNQQKQDIPIEALNMLQFLHHCCTFGGYKRKLITQYLPDSIFDQFHCLGLYSFAK
ncbi:wash complex subunit strumpellin-like protein [Dermatophagoides farinae]|uniref:Wash complex subunit strumpellin-like protein n=1 Tax=Dermatophagoides farinae TaxID=6954 RepID=A0A9D4P451_DERFA|nr:WASH complex subunit 5-like [Dermatophagoides farinae]KAH7642710.1 wash complex subunit strumpellin-like protein [Dermatophagoides farinae]